MTEQNDGVNRLLLVAGVVFAITIVLIALFFFIKRLRTFSTVFPVAKPTPGSTLPGADTQSVNYKSDSKVELKKATVVSKSLNIKGLENESGLI